MGSTKRIQFIMPDKEVVTGYHALCAVLKAHKSTIIYWKERSTYEGWFMFRKIKIYYRTVIPVKEITDDEETRCIERRRLASQCRLITVGSQQLVTRYVNGCLYRTYSIDAYMKMTGINTLPQLISAGT